MKAGVGGARRLVGLCALGLTVPATLHGQIRSVAAARAAVDSIAGVVMQSGRVAGLSIALVRGTDTIAMRGYGLANIELDVPTPPRAMYEIGSVTKQFTAAALIRLVDQGKLSLDDDLTKHLPDYPTQGHKIPLYRLLDHTSGIKGYTEIARFGTIMMRNYPRDTLLNLFKNEPFDFAPGEGMVYNNSAYFLAGLVIEKVSGKSYADFVQQEFFDTLGMADSRYCSETKVFKRKVNGYDLGPAGLQTKGFIVHAYPYAAGSLCSSVNDLTTWIRALHGGKVLSQAGYQQLMTGGLLNDGTKLRYMRGLTARTIGGHRVIEHGGAINGFLSGSAYFPDYDATMVVLMNTAGPYGPDSVAAQLARAVFGPVASKSERFTGDLNALAGTYEGVGRGRRMAMQFTVEGQSLAAAPVGAPAAAKLTLRYVGNETWEGGESARYTFERQGSNVTRVRADQVYGYSYLQRKP